MIHDWWKEMAKVIENKNWEEIAKAIDENNSKVDKYVLAPVKINGHHNKQLANDKKQGF